MTTEVAEPESEHWTVHTTSGGGAQAGEESLSRPRLKRDVTRLRLYPASAVAGRGKHLDGYITVQARVPCATHLAHAARAQQRNDFVRTEFRARSKDISCAQL